MGTRSLTHVIETWKDHKTNKKKKQTLLTMYRQYDGYPSGHGAELVEFLEGSEVVNGFGVNDEGKSKRIFNGSGCLAAQLVANFKKGVGGFYIQKPNAKDCGEEYTYEIEVDSDTKLVTLRCFKVWDKKSILFEGKPEDFLKTLKEEA